MKSRDVERGPAEIKLADFDTKSGFQPSDNIRGRSLGDDRGRLSMDGNTFREVMVSSL